ncbi:MAG: type II secretion system protein [Dehalococcoidales bacterium]|jgi:prepilin-type N-terminal cleavage/methylation domain-containing protein|nr:type II secretion system protein [Dehalococcoidales bacterium]MDD5122543.1 type II secretion system protein [Dehalococcoidales bacterium]MDX9802764.1 type II secretion system protein [Dehalococcoidales bacterium]
MLKGWFSRLFKEQRGFTFIEVLVGVAIMGMIVAAFMLALATAFKANTLADIRTTADSLARAQMEYIKSLDYSESYIIPSARISEWENKGYEVYWLDNTEAEPVEYLINQENTTLTPPLVPGYAEGLQQVTIRIKRAGENIITLEGYKATR